MMLLHALGMAAGCRASCFNDEPTRESIRRRAELILGKMMTTITKKDLVDRIAGRTSQRRVLVKQVVQAFLDEIINELGQGNRLEFRDFGVFEVKARAARIAQNPKTLERVNVPGKRTVKFKVGRLMKEQLAGASDSLKIPAPPAVATPEQNVGS